MPHKNIQAEEIESSFVILQKSAIKFQISRSECLSIEKRTLQLVGPLMRLR